MFEKIKWAISSFSIGAVPKDIAYTITLLVMVFFVRQILLKLFTQAKGLEPNLMRQRKANIRNILLLIFLGGIIAIWSEELKVVAVSLVALGAAAVLAIKEVIACWSGSLMRVSSQLYGIGDVISILHIRGKVMDINSMSTKIQEMEFYENSTLFTGQVVVFPNSLLLTNPIINETNGGVYTVCNTTIDLEGHSFNIAETKALLISITEAVCGEWIDDAQKYLNKMAGNKLIEAPNAKPQVFVHIKNGFPILLLRYSCKTSEKYRVEQAILMEFLQKVRTDKFNSVELGLQKRMKR